MSTVFSARPALGIAGAIASAVLAGMNSWSPEITSVGIFRLVISESGRELGDSRLFIIEVGFDGPCLEARLVSVKLALSLVMNFS